MTYDPYKCSKTVADTVKQHLRELQQCTITSQLGSFSPE